jgi:hypothetical protein
MTIRIDATDVAHSSCCPDEDDRAMFVDGNIVNNAVCAREQSHHREQHRHRACVRAFGRHFMF